MLSAYNVIIVDEVHERHVTGDFLLGYDNHYNFVKDLFYDVTEEEALFNFYKQILTGDRVDNIKGLKGIGDVKAKRILKECKDENEMYLAVLKAYEGNSERVLENGQLLWIRREPNQIWKPPS